MMKVFLAGPEIRILASKITFQKLQTSVRPTQICIFDGYMGGKLRIFRNLPGIWSMNHFHHCIIQENSFLKHRCNILLDRIGIEISLGYRPHEVPMSSPISETMRLCSTVVYVLACGKIIPLLGSYWDGLDYVCENEDLTYLISNSEPKLFD